MYTHISLIRYKIEFQNIWSLALCMFLAIYQTSQYSIVVSSPASYLIDLGLESPGDEPLD
jgi:hypothetical protein